MPTYPNPIKRDDKNKVVYYHSEDITSELVHYWEEQEGCYAVAKYDEE